MTKRSQQASVSRRGFLASGVAATAGIGMAGLAGPHAAAAEPPGPPGGPPSPPSPPGPPGGKVPPRSRHERFMGGVPFEPHDVVRVGIVGLGMRGGGMLGRFLNTSGVRVPALSDINPDKVAEGAADVRNAGQPDPAQYDGEETFEQLAARDD